MALVHPSRPTISTSKRELHPALCLVAGFGIMTLIATLVHLLFSLLS